LNGLPIQIKCIKNRGELCYADFNRVRLTERDYISFVIEYNENEEILDFHIHYIDHETFSELCRFDDYETLILEMDNINNTHEHTPLWHSFIARLKNSYGDENRLIRIRGKRQVYTSQKRIQCAIPRRNINNFYNLFRELTPEELLEM
jgi:hypothetical protein